MPATQVKLNQLKQTSATTGQVIAWDGTGWAPTTLSSGGSSSGTSGTIQYSDGSSGFLGDSSKLFWNVGTSTLQVTGGTTAYIGTFTGGNNGINITQGSNLTSTYTGINISGDNTQNIRAQITNTNSSSATSHASLRLSAALGDPFALFIPSSEANAVVAGIDNSSTGDIFYISRGSDPSTMTGAQFRLDGNTDSVSIRTASDAAFFRATTSIATVSGSTTDVIGGTSNINIVNAGVTVTTPLFYVGGGSGASSTITVGAGGSAQFVYSNAGSGVILNDTNASVTLWPRDGSRNITVANSGITVQSPNGFGISNSGGTGTTFLASASGTYTNTLTFPSATGVTGQFLTTNGSGVLSWSSPGDNASVITPTQITADQNNYNPTGFSTANLVRLTANGFYVITGLSAPTSASSYKQVTFTNVGVFTILFSSEDTDSTAVNRISIDQKLFALYPDESVTFIYDNTDDRWKILSNSTKVSNVREKYLIRNQLTPAVTYQWSNLNGGTGANTQGTSITTGDYDEYLYGGYLVAAGTGAYATMNATSATFKTHQTTTSRLTNAAVVTTRLRTGVTLSNATDRYIIKTGLFSAQGNGAGGPGSTTPVGMYFTYTDDDNAGAIVGRIRNSGGSTTDVVTVTAAGSTLYKLEMVILPNRQVMFYVNDTLYGKAANTNVPTLTSLFFAIGLLKSTGTSSRDFTFDHLSTLTILR